MPGRRAVKHNGRAARDRGRATTCQAACCSCPFLYVATLCHETDCAPASIYLCSDQLVTDPKGRTHPVGDGAIITVLGQCWRVEASTRFVPCPPGSPPPPPPLRCLPVGAVIIPASTDPLMQVPTCDSYPCQAQCWFHVRLCPHHHPPIADGFSLESHIVSGTALRAARADGMRCPVVGLEAPCAGSQGGSTLLCCIPDYTRPVLDPTGYTVEPFFSDGCCACRSYAEPGGPYGCGATTPCAVTGQDCLHYAPVYRSLTCDGDRHIIVYNDSPNPYDRLFCCRYIPDCRVVWTLHYEEWSGVSSEHCGGFVQSQDYRYTYYCDHYDAFVDAHFCNPSTGQIEQTPGYPQRFSVPIARGSGCLTGPAPSDYFQGCGDDDLYTSTSRVVEDCSTITIDAERRLRADGRLLNVLHSRYDYTSSSAQCGGGCEGRDRPGPRPFPGPGIRRYL